MVDFRKLRKPCSGIPIHPDLIFLGELKGLMSKNVGPQFDELEDVDVGLQIFRREHPGMYLIYVIDGVTGYESFYHSYDKSVRTHPDYRELMCQEGWSACSGTRGSYKTLKFPPETMTSLFATLDGLHSQTQELRVPVRGLRFR